MPPDRSAAVDQDCIKLTSYFSDRSGIGITSAGQTQAALDGGGVMAARVLLRGMDGSVLLHQLSTGFPVADPPVAGLVLDRSVTLTGSGFLTLERGQLLSGEIDPVGVRDDDGGATRLTVYLSRDDHVYQAPAFEVICQLLHRRGIAGATVLEGITGSLHGSEQRPRLTSRHAANPMMVVAISPGAQLGLVLPELAGLFRRPLFTLEPVHVCKRDGQLISPPPAVPAAYDDGGQRWQKLAIYACASARHGGQPVHRAIMRGLRTAGIGSAVTVRGVWGFRGDNVPHAGSRHTPAVTIVAGVPERVAAAFRVIDEITAERGLVTSNMVAGIRGKPGGTSWRHVRLARWLLCPQCHQHGLGHQEPASARVRLWHRMTWTSASYAIRCHGCPGRMAASQMMP
jgi:PII-like signaling protein